MLVLSKSAGIDDLIESQKKYNNDVLYLEFPRYFLAIIFKTIFDKYSLISDEKYHLENENVEHLKIKYRNFLIKFIRVFKNKYTFKSL